MADAERTERPGAQAWIPDRASKRSLAEGIEACRGCELFGDATQGVPGEGPRNASLMVVGEQPGDQEDRQGRPFVGPAGGLLVGALEDASVDPASVFRTNAVKHFRWDPGRAGKRIHKGPSRVHVAACGPWLVAELDLIRPIGVVLLGATAGASVYGSSFRVGKSRGRALNWPADTVGASWSPEWAVATTHPSAVLRSRNRDEDYAALVKDLRIAAELVTAT
jgi:uracil-DNA glycosylase family protein